MTERSDTDRRRGLAPPQYRLSTLLAFITVVAIVLALSEVIGAYGTFWLIVFLLGVLGHIAGNALGKQLRDHGSRPLEGATTQGGAGPAVPQVRHAPRTRLSHRLALGPLVYWGTFLGSIASSVAGLWWLMRSMQDEFTLGAALVALVAFAVLGGIWSFLAIGFLYVVVGALRQALRHDRSIPPSTEHSNPTQRT